MFENIIKYFQDEVSKFDKKSDKKRIDFLLSLNSAKANFIYNVYEGVLANIILMFPVKNETLSERWEMYKNGKLSFVRRSSSVDTHIANFKKFLSKNYEAPQDGIELVSQLESLFIFYADVLAVEPSLSISMYGRKIDFAGNKLLYKAGCIPSVTKHKGKELERLKKSKVKAANGLEERKKPVLDEYDKIKNVKKLKPHSIATIIKERLKQLGKVYSITTIKNYLKEEGRI